MAAPRTPETVEAQEIALRNCSSEPIHIPGSIQPHGFLLTVASPEGVIEAASANAAELLDFSKPLLGSRLSDVLPQVKLPVDPGTGPSLLDQYSAAGVTYQVIVHRLSGRYVLEFERFPETESGAVDFHALITQFMNHFKPRSGLLEIAQHTVSEIRAVTGFDRVLLYQFEENWDGKVIAESRNQELPSFLGHRFPASDIPSQARQLYRLNRIRIIPDAGYAPVPLLGMPEQGEPLDMSFCVLRSVSSVHLQYMRNMGTLSSMSVSLLREGELWGLISCHSRNPRRVSFVIRNACDVLAQICTAQIAAAEHREDAELRIRLKSSQTQLLAHMAEATDFFAGLENHPEELLGCTGAAGAAVLFNGRCYRCGIAPEEQEVIALAEWIRSQLPEGGAYRTSFLSESYAPGLHIADCAAGVLAVPISSLHNSFVLWFRPELPQVVVWAGDPTKPAEETDAGYRLNPRNSFEAWTETVRLRSQPWLPGEIESARELRDAIVRIVLRKAEELAQLNESLRLSNQELEAFSYSVSHDLRAPFRHIVGYSELLLEREGGVLSESGKRYIQTIIESGHFAGALVDNLLSFSQIGRASLHFVPVDTRVLVEEVRNALMEGMGDRQIEWRIGNLPVVRADLFMLRLVFQNLLSNALKYSAPRSLAQIEIDSYPGPGESIFMVRDNGVGFDPQYTGKLFGVFQRLHRMEEFAGTGIGLANVRRIVTRHGGRTWAQGEVDRGASIFFSLPGFSLPDFSLPDQNEKGKEGTGL